jgi:hypothetical protein
VVSLACRFKIEARTNQQRTAPREWQRTETIALFSGAGAAPDDNAIAAEAYLKILVGFGKGSMTGNRIKGLFLSENEGANPVCAKRRVLVCLCLNIRAEKEDRGRNQKGEESDRFDRDGFHKSI